MTTLAIRIFWGNHQGPAEAGYTNFSPPSRRFHKIWLVEIHRIDLIQGHKICNIDRLGRLDIDPGKILILQDYELPFLDIRNLFTISSHGTSLPSASATRL